MDIGQENQEKLCSACMKREAVYKRRSSGESLCKLCLIRSLIRQTRKAIHYYKMVFRNSSILYIIRPEAVAESVIGFNIYRGATKDFQLTYNVICFSNITNCEAVENIIGPNVRQFIKIKSEFKTSNHIELIKFLEAIAIKVARKINAKFVVSPLFRDELAVLSLLGIVLTSRSIFSEGLPVKVVDDIKTTRPFFYIISADVSILKVFDSIDIEPLITIDCDEAIRKAKELLNNSIELTYSSTKSIELLQTYAFGSSMRCKYCGAFSLESVCDICSRFQLFVDAVS